MKRLSIAVALLLAVSVAVLAGAPRPVLLILSVFIPIPHAQEHLWFDPHPALVIAGYERGLDEDVWVRLGVDLPLPNQYVLDRELYQVVISTHVQSHPVVTLSARLKDGSLLSLEGPFVSRCHPSTPLGLHCFFVGPASGAPLSFGVRDSEGAVLGTESLRYRVGRYGTIWETDPV